MKEQIDLINFNIFDISNLINLISLIIIFNNN